MILSISFSATILPKRSCWNHRFDVINSTTFLRPTLPLHRGLSVIVEDIDFLPYYLHFGTLYYKTGFTKPKTVKGTFLKRNINFQSLSMVRYTQAHVHIARHTSLKTSSRKHSFITLNRLRHQNLDKILKFPQQCASRRGHVCRASS